MAHIIYTGVLGSQNIVIIIAFEWIRISILYLYKTYFNNNYGFHWGRKYFTPFEMKVFRPHFGEAIPFLLKTLLRVEPCFKWQTIYMCVFQHYLKSQPAIAKQLVKLDTIWFDLIGTRFWFDLILIFGHCQVDRSPFRSMFLLKPFISLIVSPLTRPFKRCFKRCWFIWAPFPVYPFIKREKTCNPL